MSPRVELAGGIHHVTAHAVTGRPLFTGDDERRDYLTLIAIAARRCGWRVLSFCLMTNHVHLLIETPEPTLGRGIQMAHGVYARAFNERHGGRGHVFHRRFSNSVVQSEGHLLATLRYIALNPVRAGICSSPSQYAWSAHNALTGDGDMPTWLDGGRVRELISGDTRRYAALCALSDRELLATLDRRDAPDWLAVARDDYRIEIEELADYLSLSPSRVYRRLKAARAARPGTSAT